MNKRYHRELIRWIGRRFRRKRFFLVGNFVAILAAFLQLVVGYAGLSERFDFAAADLFFSIRGPALAPAEPVVVSINDGTFASLGLPPHKVLPRRYVAELLGRLDQYQVKQVILDIVFAGASESIEEDRALAEALLLTPTTIAADQIFTAYTNVGGVEEVREVKYFPLEIFERNANAVAVFRVATDRGVVRRYPRSTPGRFQYPFILDHFVERSRGQLLLPDRRALINFYGPAGSIRSISIEDILADTDLSFAEVLRDKLVLVGIQRQVDIGAGKDAFQTSWRGTPMFGVEIVATMLANLTNRSWISRVSEGTERSSLVLAIYLLALALVFMTPLKGLLLTGASASLWGVLSYWAFSANMLLPGASLFFLTLPLVLILITLHHNSSLRRKYAQVEHAFGVQLGGLFGDRS